MPHVLGRESPEGPAVELGDFLARDGSAGASVQLDLDRPHVGLVTGKRGSGKSYTLGVIAEDIIESDGVTGVVIDPMGVFGGLADAEGPAGARVVSEPTIPADSLAPREWVEVLDLDPTSAPGALLWRAGETADTLPAMLQAVEYSQADTATVQAVRNHLALAQEWGVFAPDGLDEHDLLDPALTVIDASGLGRDALGAITAAVSRRLYRAAVRRDLDRLPWLVVDEAQAVLDGVAKRSLRRILTRGRHPGVSLFLGTQRPAALPPVAISQADILLSHRLTATADIDALAAARPTYLEGKLVDQLPDGVGEAVVIDDATESAVTVQIRERRTPHCGDSPSARSVRQQGRSLSGGSGAASS